jgi:hypothetical protein
MIHRLFSGLHRHCSVHYLILLLCFYSSVRGRQVEHSPLILIYKKGNSSVLQCNFSSSVNKVQWFLQNPGRCLINLFSLPSGAKQNGKLNGHYNHQVLVQLSVHFLFPDHRLHYFVVKPQCSSGTVSP